MSHIECIAIDDEPIALSIISNFCERKGGLTLSTFCEPEVGLNEILQKRPDLVFLDIEMNGLNGLDIAQSLPQECCFIFTTAYIQYALEGFNLDAVDFLYKPFSYERFSAAVDKALRRIEFKKAKPAKKLIIKKEYTNVSIPLSEITYIEAMENYSKIFRRDKPYILSHISLKNLLEMLPPNDFIRIHRSYIIAKGQILHFNKRSVTLVSERNLPIGRQYAQLTESALKNDRLAGDSNR